MRESGYYLPHFPIAYLATAGAALGTWPFLKYVVGAVGQHHPDGDDPCWIAFWPLVDRYAKIIWLNIDLTIHPPNREDYEQRNRNASS
jgi:hypothetical protein